MSDLSLLPEGWAIETIGNLILSSNTGLVRGVNDQSSDKEFSYFKMNNLSTKGKFELTNLVKVDATNEELLKYSLQAGDFIFNTRNSVELVGKCGVLEHEPSEPVIFNNNLLRITFRHINPRIISFWFNSADGKSQLRSVTSATTSVAAIYQKALIALEVPIPPLAEQKVITDKLDELLTQVESTKARLDAIPAILKSFRQSVLAAAVSGKLTEEWRGEFTPEHMDERCKILSQERADKYVVACIKAKKGKEKKPRKPSNIDEEITENRDVLPLLTSQPLEWSRKVLAFITDNYADSIVDGPFGASINVNTDYINDGIPVIRMVNIRPFKFVKANRKFISDTKFKELYRHKIESGDVLFSKVGATTGDCCLYPESESTAMLSTTGSCRISVDKTIYQSEFLVIVLNAYRNIFNSITSQVAQPFLNMKTIKSVPIPVPSLFEQTEIVRRVEELFAFADKVEAQVNEAQTRVNNLTQSILAKAFRGELTADWRAANPDLIRGDNSAEALLEKIKVERKSMQGKKQGRTPDAFAVTQS